LHLQSDFIEVLTSGKRVRRRNAVIGENGCLPGCTKSSPCASSAVSTRTVVLVSENGGGYLAVFEVTWDEAPTLSRADRTPGRSVNVIADVGPFLTQKKALAHH
jgi:hypothetical protein